MSAKANPVGWFEIPVSDMARARAFYEHVFELELDERRMGEELMAWFPMERDVVGAAGSLIKTEGHRPSRDGVLVYFTAPDINAALDRVREKGGEVLVERTSIGEYGFVALIVDTEGNRIGLHARE
jgi:hypothetical protein